jgi:hypothetical protein
VLQLGPHSSSAGRDSGLAMVEVRGVCTPVDNTLQPTKSGFDCLCDRATNPKKQEQRKNLLRDLVITSA